MPPYTALSAFEQVRLQDELAMCKSRIKGLEYTIRLNEITIEGLYNTIAVYNDLVDESKLCSTVPYLGE